MDSEKAAKGHLGKGKGLWAAEEGRGVFSMDGDETILSFQALGGGLYRIFCNEERHSATAVQLLVPPM